jgi:toxin ParE1/3/4
MPTRAIEILDGARRDLADAAAQIDADRPRVAQQFVEAVLRDLEIVREYPLAGKRLRRSRFRSFVVDGWRHSIIYAVEEEAIVVFAFAHHSRRAGYWRNRD